MNTLHVYGDSYVENIYSSYEHWTGNVAQDLNLTEVNYGLGGTSTEYSMMNLSDDINSNSIKAGDVVIFSASSAGRLTLERQREFPNTSSKYRNQLMNKSFDETLIDDQWYHDNKKFLKWYITNIDPVIEKLHHEGCLHIVKNFAEARPDITVVLLSLDKYDITFPMMLPKNLLRPSITMESISGRELISSLRYHDFIKYTKIDSRINHFSINNSKIFGQLIVRAIETGSTEHITLDKFEKNIYNRMIKTHRDYMQYVESGHLFLRPYIINNLTIK